MKLISIAACGILLCCATLQASPRPSQGRAKITKNEAEHIALKHFPGGQVTGAKLEKVQGKLVWSLEIAPAKSKPSQHVEVDAMTGRIAAGVKEKP